MKRIKQALGLAREQRREVESAPPDEHIEPSDPATIRYSQTRTVKLNPADLSRNCIIAGNVDPAVRSAYSLLRTQVLQRLDENGWNAVSITSPSTGEGKTLTAINLAISIAKAVTHTVLLVDLDLRRPRVHEYLGYEPEYGIDDYLLSGVPIHEILFSPGIERLVVLPGRETHEDSSELISSPKMVRLSEELKQRYASRIVIFDMPPLLSVDDAMAFAPYVDAVLLVLEESRSQIVEVQRAAGYLKATPLLGAVLNKSVHKLKPY